MLLFISLLGRSSLFHFAPPPPTESYTLSLHDALPICVAACYALRCRVGVRLELPFHGGAGPGEVQRIENVGKRDRKITRLNSSHLGISYAVFCLKKKKQQKTNLRQTRIKK